MAPLDLGADAGPGRDGASRWADALPLLLLSPVLYDLGRRLGVR